MSAAALSLMVPLFPTSDASVVSAQSVAAVQPAQSSSQPNLGPRGLQKRLHAVVSAAPANVTAKAGGTALLFVDVTPNPNIHVYAPGANDYIPITVKVTPQSGLKLGKLTYPKSDVMTFGDEKVPVFQKPFRLTQPISLVGASGPGTGPIKPGETITIAASVDYQACDDKVCYPPESAPVSWTLTIHD